MEKQGKIKQLLLDMFGWEVNIGPADATSIPFAYAKAAEYAILEIESLRFILVWPADGIDLRSVKKMATAVGRYAKVPPIVVLDNIDSVKRRSLIESRIDFIVPDKQIYLPTIGILMTERGVGVKPDNREILSAVATLIIVYHLIKSSFSGKSISDIARAIGYSVKTTSIAVSELEEKGLIEKISEGRKKNISFPLSGRSLWNKARHIMANPVESVVFTNYEESLHDSVKASDYALSSMSMLQPPAMASYAVHSRNEKMDKCNFNPIDGKYRVELWKYDPMLTSSNSAVDPLSLYLSYGDDDDPRIKSELKKVIDNIL